MGRSSAPPPRWQRLTFGLAPMVGLSVLVLSGAAVEVTASESTVLDIVLLSTTLAALIFAVLMAKTVLAGERYATDEMQSRYETLLTLLTAAGHADTPLVNPRAGVVILGVDEPTRLGRDREFVRFAMEDGTAAPDGGEYRVYERFTLHEARPVVLHKVDALSVRTDPDGEQHLAPVPRPRQSKRASIHALRMATRTGIDVATIPDLDELIEQIRTASATPAP